MKPVAAYLFATVAAFASIVAVTAIWIVHLRSGPPLDGWVAGPTLVIVPIVLLLLTGFWLLARAVLGRWIGWGIGTVLAASAVGVYLLVAVACGPIACFRQGPNHAMGWFIVFGVAVAALTHHVLWTRLRRAAP